mgnify:FL=1|tara:strand:+ start:384 stop:875 length:492 start_codon:yes stop_codon:yes gene_type:complete
MEPISTALAGIALFKSAVDGIKGAIGTANDVGEIAGFIDKLFEGEKQVQQRRNQQSGVSVGDQFGVTNVAREIIDAKLAQEQMQEIASMVDMRFGHGTWRSIVDERAKRIREAKEAEAEARRKKRQEERERAENMKRVLMISGAILVAALLFLGMIFTIARSS